jgi:uncharacterized membrane protein
VTPERMRTIVRWVLLTGVSLAAALLAAGLLGSFVVGWRGSLIGLPHADTSIVSFADLGAGLAALRPQAIAQLGLVVLVATPVVRVLTSLVAFALERDRLYVGITAAVLVILLAAVFLIR